MDAAAIVDGDYAVVDSARRNRNLKVIYGGGGYVIKQPDRSAEQSERTLRTEGAFYRLCRDDERAAPVRAHIPRLVAQQPEDGLLVIELLEHAVPLWALYAESEPPVFPVEPAARLGRALGTLHATFRRPAFDDAPALQSLPTHAPWILWVHRPGPAILEQLSAANLQTLKIVQQQVGLAVHLDALRRDWRIETLLHGDVKSDNVLVWRRAEDAGVELRLVDFELIQRGDPAWDVGGALADFLLFWIASIPLDARRRPDEMLAEARYPLSSLQPAVRALWSHYRREAGLEPAVAGEFLARAVRSCAARLIQTAYEQSQEAPALSNPAVALLQVAVNTLADPEGAQLHLFGLPLAGTPAARPA